MATVKMVCGLILLAITIASAAYIIDFRFSHPSFTETQLFNETIAISLPAMAAGFVGLILLKAGLDDGAE